MRPESLDDAVDAYTQNPSRRRKDLVKATAAIYEAVGQARPVCIKVQNDSILRDCMEIDSFVTKSLEPLKAIDVTQVCVCCACCACCVCCVCCACCVCWLCLRVLLGCSARV